MLESIVQVGFSYYNKDYQVKYMKQVNFLKTFLKDKNVAALTPTSSLTIKKICSNIDFSKDLIIVEYGPGTGVCTKAILKQLSANSKLITIETNKDFISYLNTIKDSRLINIKGSAQDVLKILNSEGISQVDYVVSSIPFTFFSSSERASLVSSTHRIIKPGGSFIVYQYSPLMKKYLKDCDEKVAV